MRIDNSYLAGIANGDSPLPAGDKGKGVGSVGNNAQNGDTNASTSISLALHVPSPELSQLRESLQTSPDVRPEVLARVSSLLQSGYYFSAEAAVQTADSMLRAVD